MKNIFNTNKLKIDFEKQINLNIRTVKDVVTRTITYKVLFQYPPEMKKECFEFLKNEKATENAIHKAIDLMKERNLTEIDMPMILQEAQSSFFDEIEKQKVSVQ